MAANANVPSPLREALYVEFPPEALGTLSKGGRNLTYVSWQAVADRLNRVFGIGGWRYEIVSVTYHSQNNLVTFAVAHGRLHFRAVNDSGSWEWSYRDGMGGQVVNRKSAKADGTPGDVLDLGDDAKGASMDALKKAAQLLGVGMYLSDKGGAVGANDEAERTAEQKANEPDDAAVDALKGAIASLTDEEKAEVKGLDSWCWPPTKVSVEEAMTRVMAIKARNALAKTDSTPDQQDELGVDLDAVLDPITGLVPEGDNS